MNFDFNQLLPNNPSSFEGSQVVRIAVAVFLFAMVARSCIHLFTSDGGAQKIGGVDLSVEGGNNIVAMFHLWGAIQLILAVLLWVLYFQYPGLTPLIVLTIALDPALRFVAGRILKLTTTRTPPGAALNAPAFVILMLLFAASLRG